MTDTQFFKSYQKQLVWFINTKLGRWFFKVDKEIRNICEVSPNALTYNKHLERQENGEWREVKTTCFRTNNKYALLLNYRLKYLHKLAFIIPSLAKPELSPLFVPVMLTTDTFYPDADPETYTVDGSAYDFTNNASWSSKVSSVGTASGDNNAIDALCAISCDPYNGDYNNLTRSFFLFKTDSLSSDNIDSATLSVYGYSKTDNLGITPNINVYSSNPSSNTAIVASDFSKVGSTPFSTAIAYSSFSITGYNDFSLNSDGKSNINKSGISKFSIRNANYDVANNAPTKQSGINMYSQIVAYFADQSGTSSDPKLTVTHSASTIAYSMTAEQGSFSLTGQSATLKRGWTLTANAGSFILTGINNVMRYGKTLIASSGSFHLTGYNTLFHRTSSMIAGTGTFVYMGYNAVFKKGFYLLAEKGEFVVSMLDVYFSVGKGIIAEAGSFVLTGYNATFHKAITLLANAGNFVVTWKDVFFRGTFYTHLAKHAATWTNAIKNVSSWVNDSKSETTWTNIKKSDK